MDKSLSNVKDVRHLPPCPHRLIVRDYDEALDWATVTVRRPHPYISRRCATRSTDQHALFLDPRHHAMVADAPAPEAGVLANQYAAE